MKKIIIAGLVGLMFGLASQKLIAYCLSCSICNGTGRTFSTCRFCNGAGGTYERCYICSGQGEKCY